MAKTKQQKHQQLLVIYFTICLVILSLLMKLDSVSAFPLDGNGNMQQQEQQQTDNNVQEQNDNEDPFKQRSTTIVPKNAIILEDEGDDDGVMKTNSLNDDITRNQLVLSHSYEPIVMVKRAPVGFVGMRGKKLYEETGDNDMDNAGIENNNEIDNDNKFPWNQLHSSNDDINWDEYIKENVRRYKKTPTAFYGVRGKKFATMNGPNPGNDNHRWQEFLDKLEEERVHEAILQDFLDRLTGSKNDVSNEMAKRAPTGFTGLRGKRPVTDELDTSMETLTKRGFGNNAFVGLRGKKDVSHQTFKRSPMGSSTSGEGKDFNNKFVAVRGKRAYFYPQINMPDINNMQKKKMPPTGFNGIRGKRLFAADVN